MKDLYNLTVSETVRLVSARAISPVEIVSSLLDRITSLEPQLQAWVTVDPEGALEAAKVVEKKVASGEIGRLCGVAIGVKDVFYTAGMRTTAGSSLYDTFVPGFDATCVARLKAEGAIILGKTVTTQFALGDPTLCRNPWSPSHNPGGSSTGSAVAVAARMCPAAVANQTGGSTLRPASYNGVVGLKPTYGRISKHGMFPCAWSNDTVGVIVRTVEDAARMLQVMAGYDPYDPSSSMAPVDDYMSSLSSLDRPPRIGLIREHFLEVCDNETRRIIEETVQSWASKGAEIHEVKLPAIFSLAPSIHRIIGNAETAAFHEQGIQANPDSYLPRVRASIESGMLISAVAYIQAQRLKRVFKREMEALIHPFDVVMTPSTPTPPKADLTNTGDPRFQAPWTLAGLPAISIPCGLSSEGLPMGVQLVARSFGESRLLAVAQWCEQALGLNLRPPL